MVNSQDNEHNQARSPQNAASARSQLRELVEESFHTLREGEVVRGTVVAVTDSDVVVDIGFKSEGIIPRGEFLDREGRVTVKAGDEVDVLVERFDEMMGEIRLSRDRKSVV